MPGIVLYNRRWALGSDDILLPAVVLAALHITWWERKPLFAETFPFREKNLLFNDFLFSFRLVVLTVVLAGVELDGGEDCQVKTPLDGISDSFCSFQVSSSLLP